MNKPPPQPSHPVEPGKRHELPAKRPVEAQVGPFQLSEPLSEKPSAVPQPSASSEWPKPLPQPNPPVLSEADAKLISLSQKGDLVAFDRLITQYRSTVYATIYSLTHHEQDAWDLAQETFIKAWRHIGQFQGKSKFSTWLHRIATNVTIDWRRRQQVESGVEFDDTLGLQSVELSAPTAPKPYPAPEAGLKAHEIQARIDAALRQLSPEHRAAIQLREVEGLRYEEIAETLGCTVGTVMSRLFYARKKLQTLLRDVYEAL